MRPCPKTHYPDKSVWPGEQTSRLLQLNDTPPNGAMLAGWSTVINPYQVTGIHHPQGDWKKISFGIPDELYRCYHTDGDSYHCVPSPTGSFLRVEWTDGGTEGGSSGSGLFNTRGELMGTLMGGGGGDCAGLRDRPAQSCGPG